jgi:hypothetical protein
LTIFINCNICCLSNKRRIFFGFLYFARKFWDSIKYLAY